MVDQVVLVCMGMGPLDLVVRCLPGCLPGFVSASLTTNEKKLDVQFRIYF